MDFSDKDRILIENLYIFKSYGANKLIREFPNKDWQCSTRNIYALLFLYSVIFLHKMDIIRKE